MDVEINTWAVVLAGASSMAVGAFWYSPGVFGKAWMRFTKSKMGEGAAPAKMAWMYGSVFVASLVTAYVLAHITFLANKFFGNSFMYDAMCTAFWLWLGLTAARLYTHDTFEERRKKLTLINLGNELVTVMVMALIIGLMKP